MQLYLISITILKYISIDIHYICISAASHLQLSLISIVIVKYTTIVMH